MVKDGCGQSGHGSVNLTVAQEWIDEITDFCMLAQIQES